MDGNGTTVRLQPQPAAVLTTLLERAPALVGREELRERLWPDTLVEFDQGINFCVRQIREALGESAADPRFVETLPRRGYRFIAEVVEVGREGGDGGDGDPPSDEASGAEGPDVLGGMLLTAAAFVLLLLSVAVGRLALGGSNHAPAEPRPGARTFAEAGPGQAAPEGRRVRIAVLPFRQGAAAVPPTAGLALAEAVTAGLAEDPELGVVGPASTRSYTGERADTDVVGSELAVRYVLSGAIEPRRDSTLFFAQLVRVSDLEHVWAERVVLAGSPAAGIPDAARRAAIRVRGLLTAPDTGRTRSGIAWERTGSGPAVVLVHGSNLDRRLWAEEARLLRDDRTVVRYDLRAHGRSAGADAPFSDVEDLESVLADAGIGEADIVGLSSGARIALDFALTHPDRVRSLILAAPTVSGYRPSADERPPFAPALEEALAAGDVDRAADLLLETPVYRVDGPARDRVAAMVRANDRLWSVDPGLAARLDPPAVDRLGSLTVPTLVVAGDDDLLAVRRQAELLARELPDARLERIAGGGHLLNLNAPRRFRELVFRFLGVATPGG